MESVLLLSLAVVTAGIGALGGLGGAVIMVPTLVLVGMPASHAAPLGLLSVASGSLAAGGRQLVERTVHHRLGVTTETAASAGAVSGALLSGAVSESTLTRILALVALGAAFAASRGRDRHLPLSVWSHALGEERGTLAGAYPVGGKAAPYQASHLPLGLGFMSVAGLAAGLAGVSGGFIKTPVTTEVMGVPVKVAASTTTFTVGVTSAAALIVLAFHGRIDLHHAAPVIAGSLMGGEAGARLQARLGPSAIRLALASVLVVIAAILFINA